MKPTLKDFKQLQEKYLHNKELFDKEKKIEGTRGREDGYEAEDLVIRTLEWTKYNHTNYKEIDADAGSILGLVDIKTGSAKKYDNTFCLEVIQNPKTALKEQSVRAGLSDWTVNLSINHLAYLDLSDDEFPLYIYSVEKLRSIFGINQIMNHLSLEHMEYYSKVWSWNGKLQTPRQATHTPATFWCFGKSALGFALPTDLASDKIVLSQLVGEEEDGVSNTTGDNPVNQTKARVRVSNNKKQS